MSINCFLCRTNGIIQNNYDNYQQLALRTNITSISFCIIFKSIWSKQMNNLHKDDCLDWPWIIHIRCPKSIIFQSNNYKNNKIWISEAEPETKKQKKVNDIQKISELFTIKWKKVFLIINQFWDSAHEKKTRITSDPEKLIQFNSFLLINAN